jgi:hypothetical protein
LAFKPLRWAFIKINKYLLYLWQTTVSAAFNYWLVNLLLAQHIDGVVFAATRLRFDSFLGQRFFAAHGGNRRIQHLCAPE